MKTKEEDKKEDKEEINKKKLIKEKMKSIKDNPIIQK